MTLNMKQVKEWAWLGAIAGIILPLFIKLLANIVPSITIQLASIAPAQTVNPGFSSQATTFFLDMVKFNLNLPTFILAAIGGAITVIIGAWIYSLRPVGNTAYAKLFAVLFYAGLAFSLLGLVGAGFAGMIPILFALSLNAAVTAFLILMLSKAIPIIKIP